MALTTVSQHVVSVNAIQGTLIADNAITAVHIATNAVSGTLIADNAVTATHIAQNTITVTQLADDAVEADKIADGVITTNHLNKAMISSQTEVTPVAGDFVLIGDTSDSNNLKKTPISGITALATVSGIASSADATAITIDSSERVGIGTGSPTQTLDVRGGSGTGTHTHAIFTGTSSRGVELRTRSDISGGQHSGCAEINSADSEGDGGDIALSSNGNVRMFIHGTGKVAVGNTDPSYKFEVSGTGGTRMMVENTDTNWAALDIRAGGNQSNYIFFKDDSAERARIQVLDGNDIAISTGDSPTERMRIHDEGYVVKAYQPYIRCAGNNGSMVSNQGTTADYSNWSDQVQRGITRSGAVFTVPVAGEYLITYSFYNWINNSGPGTTHAVYLQKGTTTVQEITAEYDFENDSYSYYDNNLGGSIVLNMAAGDTFKFVAYADIYGGATHTNMSAYLLG